MLLSEVSKSIDIIKTLHQKSNKYFNKINSSSKEVDQKTIVIEREHFRLFFKITSFSGNKNYIYWTKS